MNNTNVSELHEANRKETVVGDVGTASHPFLAAVLVAIHGIMQ
jgi:hypothetical protein